MTIVDIFTIMILPFMASTMRTITKSLIANATFIRFLSCMESLMTSPTILGIKSWKKFHDFLIRWKSSANSSSYFLLSFFFFIRRFFKFYFFAYSLPFVVNFSKILIPEACSAFFGDFWAPHTCPRACHIESNIFYCISRRIGQF